MKSTHKVERFDYSKIESRDDMRYFGIHPKYGRIHIDTKRYRKILEEDGITEFLPEEIFENRRTPYFIPTAHKRSDYKFNIFKDLINDFRNEWVEEYRPLFRYIKSPTDIYNTSRTNGIMITSCADDIDEIECEAFISAFRRRNQYKHVIKSLYCAFISKLSTEIDRITLVVLTELGYKSKDFNFNSFVKFSDGLQNDKQGKRIHELNEYNAYDLLHKLNNFLKHNSIRAYEDLRKWYPKCVTYSKNCLTSTKYQNGMFAGDWIIIDDGYIDNLFDKLIEFFKDYCSEYLKEDVSRAEWDYDDYFRSVYNRIKDLTVYWGI